MRLTHLSLLPLLGGLAQISAAVTSWTFQDATIAVASKGAGIGGAEYKDKLSPGKAISKSVVLGPTDNLKVTLTTVEGNNAKRPHQAFLTLKDVDTLLESTFAFTVKESGKGKVDLALKDVPIQLLTASKPLEASIILGSFGRAKPAHEHVFDVSIQLESNSPMTKYVRPFRNGKLPVINHIFKADPATPPKIISFFFAAVVMAVVPFLFGAWLYLDANLQHLQAALSSAPVSHVLFVGSVISMECLFFLYYTTLTLFQLLPLAALVGVVGFLAGSKALSEVQSRRLAGKR